jgi:hypothetical protein
VRFARLESSVKWLSCSVTTNRPSDSGHLSRFLPGQPVDSTREPDNEARRETAELRRPPGPGRAPENRPQSGERFKVLTRVGFLR